MLYVGWSLVTHVLTTVSGSGPPPAPSPSPSPHPVPPPTPVASAFLYDLRYVTTLPTLEAGFEEEHLVAAIAGLANRAAPNL